MNKEMKAEITANPTTAADKIAVFMQQMIPHHQNAVNMAKLLLKHTAAAAITSAMDEDGLTGILWNIINVQNYEIHQFRNYLNGLAPSKLLETDIADTTTGTRWGYLDVPAPVSTADGKTDVVVVAVTAQGAPGDYLNTLTAYNAKFANQAGVAASLVSTTVVAASALLTTTIVASSPLAALNIQIALRPVLADASAASAFLGVTVEQIPDISVARVQLPIASDNKNDDTVQVVALATVIPCTIILVALLAWYFVKKGKSSARGSVKPSA
jgi:hypothetical protein